MSQYFRKKGFIWHDQQIENIFYIYCAIHKDMACIANGYIFAPIYIAPGPNRKLSTIRAFYTRVPVGHTYSELFDVIESNAQSKKFLFTYRVYGSSVFTIVQEYLRGSYINSESRIFDQMICAKKPIVKDCCEKDHDNAWRYINKTYFRVTNKNMQLKQ